MSDNSNPPYGSNNETPVRPETKDTQRHVQVNRADLKAAGARLRDR